MSFTLLPAVDVADGRAVRLVQGEAESETSHGTPLAASLAWQAAGAEWIHLVDLDAALELALSTGCTRVILSGRKLGRVNRREGALRRPLHLARGP